ncbi:MAG: hypothetical protein HYR66_10155, partial [Sphingobacteriales bacterium]|nr:hypothetical protein [Sphingobacteriales bacterium]
MSNHLVNINFTELSKAFKKYIWEKGSNSSGTIGYIEKGKLIEENPATSKKRILKEY